MEDKRSRVTRKKRKKVKVILTIALLLIGIYVTYIAYQAVKAARDSYTELDRGTTSNLRNEAVKFGKEPVSILLLGIENYATGGSGGRADSIIVATFNPNLESVKLLSIPRDTRVYIPSKDKEDKINHSYNDGTESTIDTVENFLSIPIDYYATVDFDGFKGIIDEIGGINVEVPFDFWEYSDSENREKIYFTKGMSHLNGEEALAYVRMRKRDPKGDFGRGDRQKQVIQASIDSLLSPSNILKFDNIFSHVGDNIQTNLKISDCLSFITNFSSFSSENITNLSLKGSGTRIKNIYYFIPEETSISQVKQELKDHLNYEGE